MDVVFLINRLIEGREQTTVTVSVDSADVNLIETIRSVVEDKCEYELPCRLAFGKYYSNMDLMNFDECFPFILRNGKYEWTVPYSTVTIQEFLDTNDLKESDVIEVDVNNYGGGDADLYGQIILWVTAAWPYITTVAQVSDVALTVCAIANKVFSYFGNRRNQVPWPKDISEAVMRQSKWEKEKLASLLGTDDDEILELLLVQSGFKERNGVYRSSKERYNRYWKLVEKSADDCWGFPDQEFSSWRGSAAIRRACYEINVGLTALLLHSQNLKSECYDIALHRLEVLIRQTPYLQRGKYFRYVLPSKNIQIEDDEEYLVEELESVKDLIRDLMSYIDNKNSDVPD